MEYKVKTTTTVKSSTGKGIEINDAMSKAIEALSNAMNDLTDEKVEECSIHNEHMNVKVEGKNLIINGIVESVVLNGKEYTIKT